MNPSQRNDPACGTMMQRRHWLKVGAMSLGALSLPEMLRREASANEGQTRRGKSVIFVVLAGGASQLETYDPKPAAPVEFRGPLGVIQTRAPGVAFSELMVEQARISDKLTIIRSLHHDYDFSSDHTAAYHLIRTGYVLANSPANFRLKNPSCGAVVSRVLGANASGMFPYVFLPNLAGGGDFPDDAVYLGPRFNSFQVLGDPSSSRFEVKNLARVRGLDAERISNRKRLLDQFNHSRQKREPSSEAASDHFLQQAFEIVAGSGARAAFDLSRESEQSRDRYGRNHTGQGFLLARRLIEAGVRFVEILPRGGTGGGWDDHDGIEKPMRLAGPAYDRGLAALVSDLQERGLDRDVLVVALGEFGRTPRINPKRTGRDHWPSVFSAVVAGGGFSMGQVIGSSTARAELPASSPYLPQNLLATVYRHLGIDARRTFPDHTGRPRYILEERDIIRELL